MISYNSGLFGFELLFRLHGSALYKSIPPAIFSTIIYIILWQTTNLAGDDDDNGTDGTDHTQKVFRNADGMAVLVTVLMFLLQFRANFAYGRYWDATSAVHLFHGKLIDCGSEIAAFHLQSKQFNNNRPPSYGSHPELSSNELNNKDNNITIQPRIRTRTIINGTTPNSTTIDQSSTGQDRMGKNSNNSKMYKSMRDSIKNFMQPNSSDSYQIMSNKDTEQIEASAEEQSLKQTAIDDTHSQTTTANKQTVFSSTTIVESSYHDKALQWRHWLHDRTLSDTHSQQQNALSPNSKKTDQLMQNTDDSNRKSSGTVVYSIRTARKKHHYPTIIKRHSQNELVESKVKEMTAAVSTSTSTSPPSIASTTHTDDPVKSSLFLQEVAHLLSLLSAVALSTLRNDIEGTQSPLIEFTPNQPFPHVDPDSYSADVKEEWIAMQSKYCSGLAVLSYMFGRDRTKKHRALYNAARPFRVIGNVSDDEIRMLQRSRGPAAKVSLVTMWLNEFLIRESLNGSFGTMDPPIISRLWQLVSDAMTGYNTARMISYNPFPFPSAQLTSFFVLAVLILLPLLMLTYTSTAIIGLLFNFMTVMCFTGLHEVARELEVPFRNTPNDIPLNNYQGQYNESLMTMFYGYHPDSFWEVHKVHCTDTEKE